MKLTVNKKTATLLQNLFIHIRKVLEYRPRQGFLTITTGIQGVRNTLAYSRFNATLVRASTSSRMTPWEPRLCWNTSWAPSIQTSPSGDNIIKLFCPWFADFRNKLECLSLASFLDWSNKHSSLVWKSANHGQRKLYKIVTRAQCYQTFSVRDLRIFVLS